MYTMVVVKEGYGHLPISFIFRYIHVRKKVRKWLTCDTDLLFLPFTVYHYYGTSTKNYRINFYVLKS
jgi:hypothetical protein